MSKAKHKGTRSQAGTRPGTQRSNPAPVAPAILRHSCNQEAKERTTRAKSTRPSYGRQALARYPEHGSCPRKGVPAPSLPHLTTSPDLGGFSDSSWPSSQCPAHHPVLPALLLVLNKPTSAPSLPPPLCPKQLACASEGPHAPPTSAQNLPSQLGLT